MATTARDLSTTVTIYVNQICKENAKNNPGIDDAKDDNASSDKVLNCYPGVMIKDWTQSNVVISIINNGKEYGLLMLSGRKLATDCYIDIRAVEMFPIDKTFRCDVIKAQTNSKGIVPIRVTTREVGSSEMKQIKIQLENSETALNMSNQVRRIVEKLPDDEPAAPAPTGKGGKDAQSKKAKMEKLNALSKEFPWMRKYVTISSQERRTKIVHADSHETIETHYDDSQGMVEEFGLQFADPSSFQTILQAPATMAAMMLTGLVIANPLKSIALNKKTASTRAFLPADFVRKKLANAKRFDADVALTWLRRVEHRRSLLMDPTNLFIRRKLMEREKEYCTCDSHSIFIGTWNVNTTFDPNIDLKAWLETGEIMPDFYVLGLQDIMPDSDPNPGAREEAWLTLIEKAHQFQETAYVRLSRCRLANVLLVIYVRKELYKKINSSEIVSASHAFGVDGMLVGYLLSLTENVKGAVAIRFSLLHTSICFICCNLTSGDNVDKRNEEFHEIVSKLVFENKSGQTYTLKQHDIVFFFGALNYRTFSLDAETVQDCVLHKDFDHLLSFDELNREKLAKRAFTDYLEGDIHFPPTSKYDLKTDELNLSEVPSYTDRILWIGNRCDDEIYRINEDYVMSANKPISTLFNVGFRRIDERLLHKTYEAVVRNLDLLYNLSLPNVHLDTHDIHFGKVRFLESKQVYVTAKNIGLTSLSYEFNADIRSNAPLPPWLKIHPASMDLEKDEDVKIMFEVTITGDSVFLLHSGESDLNQIVTLALLGGKHMFINISGEFVPTCFGLPLNVLQNLQKPVRQIKATELMNLVKTDIKTKGRAENDSKRPFNSTGQVFRMVDYITNKGIKEKEIFQKPGFPHDILAVIEALDATSAETPLPEVSIHSMIEVLLIFLNCLPEPIIPNNYTKQALDNCEDKAACLAIIKKISVTHRNLFNYIVTFLKKCLDYREKNGTDPSLLASIFGEIIIRDPPKVSPEASRYMKMTFIKHFLEPDGM